MDENSIKRGILYTIIGSVCWGISDVCMEYLFSSYVVESAWLTAVRMILSGILLLLPGFFNDNKVFEIFKNRQDTKRLCSFAIFGLLMCQYSFLSAIKYSNSGTATVLQSLNVVMMAVTISVMNKTKLEKQQIVSIVLAVFGVYMIATKGKLSEMAISFGGLFWGLLAGVTVITYTLLPQKIIDRWGSMHVTGWGLLIGGAVMGVISRVWNIPQGLDFVAILMVAVIVTAGTAVAFTLFLYGTKLIGPIRSTLIACLEPVIATAMSALVLGTKFGLPEIIGFIAIMTTVVLSLDIGKNKKQRG